MEPSAYCSPDTTELAKAMLKVQSSLQPAFKDRENTFSHSRYATLNSVMDSCRDALIANSIWLSQYPVPVESGHMGLVTKLTHADSGQWQSSLLVMPLPKADPQGFGSALTYGRRYALAALVGIVADDDDDGVLAGVDAPARARRKRQMPEADTTTNSAVPSAPPSEPQTHPVFADLPKLDGIQYSTTQTQDGKVCVIASGNTRDKKQILAKAGFKWSDQRKVWWRYADAA